MHGLASIFPTPKTQVTILSVVGERMHDVNGEPFGAAELKELKSGRNIYLLAPSESVMSKPLDDGRNGLPLTLVAEEVLPFEAAELIIARDHQEDTIFAIEKSELTDQRQMIDASGLALAGIAFRHGVEFVLAEEQPRTAFENQKTVRTLLVALLVIGILFFSTLGLLSRVESQRQAVLADQLNRLQAELNSQPSNSERRLLEKVKIRSAADIVSLLSPLADSLTEKVVVDQLIISGNELLIDAKAPSATQVLANIEASGVFESSEFVTSISRSTSENLERFRLKINVKAEQ
jgi:hypothetical protein